MALIKSHFLQWQIIKSPLVSDKAKTTIPNVKQVYEYDVTTKAGGEYIFAIQ